MDMRIPIGTAAIALLALPLGYQLYTSTSMTPSDLARQHDLAETQAPVAGSLEPVADAAPKMAETPALEVAPPPPIPAAPMPVPATANAQRPQQQGQAMSRTSAVPYTQNQASMGMSYEMGAPAAQWMPSDTVQSGDVFADFDEQRLKLVAEEPVSTFSIDVDTASYSYVRRMLEDGIVPPPDAVRIEELINYFPYDYPAATSAEVPFQPTMAVYPTPWNPATQLLQIGIKGFVPPVAEDRPSNLVFLIDTSGSMDAPDKLPLLKRAFGLLVDQLSGNDTVSIVAYAGSAGVVLEPTAASEKTRILSALDQLSAGGSTAGAEGIALAYQLAAQAKVEGGTNRVILATDGDFNVGIAEPAALIDFIKARRQDEITLSVLGFGRGNLDDAVMQALAQNGNGNASYISNFREAQKVLVEEMGGTLHMIAKDVKIQVEFNPAQIAEYRLIGYETRALNREDFNNDAVDAGDIGAGTTVTALYEITPVGSVGALVDPLRYGQPGAAPAETGELAFLRMRYKLPQSDVSQLIEAPVNADLVYGDIDAVTPDMRFAAAVAAFGQKLKGSGYGGAMSWDAIKALAQSGKGADEGGYRAEFIQLVQTASLLRPDTP
ncbi:VWA domain-containing protein [Devosia sp.]|uniref:vWA domain-containing protein n=1 Tax=Devosia sp. TaxID=1871048 RepID=UPI002AFF7658|nr:VWA domain-containing protein [Devosia sp.]